MSGRRHPGLTAALALSLTVLAAGFARAQEPEDPPVGASQNLGEIDDLLADEESMLAGTGYSYDPENRRDPFKSLLAARARPLIEGPRPDGVPGLLIDDIDLTGIFIVPEGPVAQVLSADRNESFLIREGDRLYDGEVVTIHRDEVVFRQVVDDPTAIKPYREVVQRLNPEGSDG